MSPAVATIADLLRTATEELSAAGVPSPRHDAEALAAHVAGVPRGRLLSIELGPPDEERFRALVAARAARVPLQYLTGSTGFRRIELAVGPGVFIPRPETEALVEWCVQALAGRPHPTVVDLCSGSGAIALAIADEVPGAVVHAVERDDAAYDWLTRNAAGTGVRCLHADAADALGELAGSVDLVASNPPYIASGDAATTDPEVREHEPPLALWSADLRAPGDGLAGIDLVAAAARRLLRDGGLLAIEHGDTQGPAAVALLAHEGFTDVRDHEDLAGRPRFVTGIRP